MCWRTLILVSMLMGCASEGADPGLRATMRVEGAQFFPGPMPEGSDGPEVALVYTQQPGIRPGMREKPVRGSVGVESTAVAFELAGDVGYWVLPAGLPASDVPGVPAFSTNLSFGPFLLAGEHELVVRAVDGGGRFGPPYLVPLQAEVPVPEGELVIALRWDRYVDLDLHVVDPAGVEIWARDINSWKQPPPGSPPDPDGWMLGGILDSDSNSQCEIDGRNRENVVWATVAPPGRYQVRVDLFSVCDETSTRWQAEVLHRGERLAAAEGVMTELDSRPSHEKGAGLLVLEVDVP